MAEADGNRTRQDCVAALLIGFEVRARHQRGERFRCGLYCKIRRPERPGRRERCGESRGESRVARADQRELRRIRDESALMDEIIAWSPRSPRSSSGAAWVAYRGVR